MKEEELIDITQILLAIIKKEKGNYIKMEKEEIKKEVNKIKSVSMKIDKDKIIIKIEER